ncbi:hypothetical protein [Hypericibacter sp.]|uniref:hypothetical protein n=1 Tax=Hypericibacter sp. TaxID=2705401 RepID=UPI003D6D95B7
MITNLKFHFDCRSFADREAAAERALDVAVANLEAHGYDSNEAVAALYTQVNADREANVASTAERLWSLAEIAGFESEFPTPAQRESYCVNGGAISLDVIG